MSHKITIEVLRVVSGETSGGVKKKQKVVDQNAVQGSDDDGAGTSTAKGKDKEAPDVSSDKETSSELEGKFKNYVTTPDPKR